MSAFAEQLKTVSDRKLVPVDVPEWSCVVYAGSLSAIERVEFRRRFYDKAIAENEDQRLAIGTYFFAFDEKGNRLFDESDLPTLSGKSSLVLDRIVNAGADLLYTRKDDSEKKSPAPQSGN